MLKVAEIIKRLEHIQAVASDDEAAHSKEDELHQAVLDAIANGECELPSVAARIALETLKIKFCRWCA